MSSTWKRLGVVCVMASAGCALTPRSIAREMASATPPAAIQSTLHALNDAENQRLVTQLIESPELHLAARNFAGEIADSAMDVMTEPERVARIEEMSSRYAATLTRTLTRSIAAGLRRDLAPAIAEVTRETVAGVLREALREGYQRDLERVAGGVTRATVEAASRSMAEGLARDLIPTLRQSLGNEQTATALASVSRALAREVVLGSNDAMTQLQRQQERTGHTSFLSRLSSLTEDGVKIMQLIAVAAVALAVLLGVWVLRLTLRGRRMQAESERNAAAAMMFAEAIRASEGKPWSKELTDILQQRLNSDAVTGLIDEVLTPREKGKARRATRPSIAPSASAGHGT